MQYVFCLRKLQFSQVSFTSRRIVEISQGSAVESPAETESVFKSPNRDTNLCLHKENKPTS